MPIKYKPQDLIQFSEQLFLAAGLAAEKAQITAQRLVEGDMMGHDTHGLALCVLYLSQIESGEMQKDGQPIVLVDHGSTLVWDAQYLPGLWVVYQAIETAKDRIKDLGVVSFSIRKSTHIACLQSLLMQATDLGYMVIIASSDPKATGVAPYGGIEPKFTPNPIAVGIPTDKDPILIDISASITTHGLTTRYAKSGKKMPGKWLQDHEGNLTDDPAVFVADPPGTILPIGGQEYGHKGFALALMIEALSQALSGFGRVDNPAQWGASIFLQLIDPSAFSGQHRFEQIMGGLAESCRQSPPIPGGSGVRMPGEAALKRFRVAQAEGLALYPGIMDDMAKWADRYGIAIPQPIT